MIWEGLRDYEPLAVTAPRRRHSASLAVKRALAIVLGIICGIEFVAGLWLLVGG